MYRPSKPSYNTQTPETYETMEVIQLVAQLNDLMNGLDLPISIISPTDLTPSLLIAVLESLLGEKIPISYPPSRSQEKPNDLKVQKVKIFLGVLETDVLQQDVGLSDIDPRKLANGDWDEVVTIAEVLVWIGEHVGLLPQASSSTKKKQTKPLSPKKASAPSRDHSFLGDYTGTLSSAGVRTRSGRFSSPELDTESVFYAPTTSSTKDTNLTLSAFLTSRDEDNESVTTVNEELHDPHSNISKQADESIATPSSIALSLLPPFESPRPSRRRPSNPKNGSSTASCIHQIPSSLLLSSDDATFGSTHSEGDISSLSTFRRPSQIGPDSSLFDQDTSYSQDVPVRYSGYIEPADEDLEIASYEHSRSSSFSPESSISLERSILGQLSNASLNDTDDDAKARALHTIEEEYHRTLKLLDERARLLKELADLDGHHG